MDLRVITLRYDDGLGGFPEDAVRKATGGRDLHAVREYFFVHAGVPHLTLVLTFGDGTRAEPQRRPSGPDPMASLPPDRRKLYLDLKRWRNQRADQDGVPPFTIMRNDLLATICRLAPKSLAALREISGIGEKTVARYGSDILSCLPEELTPLEDAPRGEAPEP